MSTRKSVLEARLVRLSDQLRRRGAADLVQEVDIILAELKRPGARHRADMMTTGEAARSLGVRSVNTIKRWVSEGRLEGHRLGFRVLISSESVARLSQDPGRKSKAPRRQAIAGNIGEIAPRIVPILKAHGITRACLFGSVVRGEAHSRSDVDVLIEVPKDPGMDLFEFVGVKLELEDALGRKVDLVTYDTLKPQIKQGVLAEAVRIL